MACVSWIVFLGNEYMFRERAEGSNAITEIFAAAQKNSCVDMEWKFADAKLCKK